MSHFPVPSSVAGKLNWFDGLFLIQRSTAMVTSSRPKPPRNRVAVSTRDLARRLRKRLNKSTEEIEAAVAKVKNNAETAIKELEAKRT